MDRWSEKGLDGQFTALWADPTLSSRYSPLCDGSLDDGTPRPACVFEQDPTQTITMMSTDTAESVRAMSNVQMQFRIHAHSKTQAIDLAKLVAAAFDNASFAAGGSCVIAMRRLAEFGARDGSEGWMWVVRYVLIHDADQAIST